MPPITPEKRAGSLLKTKEAALALLEDIEHIREVVANPDPTRAQIRRLSATLRRLLVEGDMTAVTAPRLGAFSLTAPDNKPAYAAEKRMPFLFFSTGGASVLGTPIGAMYAFDVVRWNPFQPVLIPQIALGDTVDLSLDSFMSQRILCYRGAWVTRRQVIKYVANVCSGVHSGGAVDQTDVTLSQIRNACLVKRDGKGGLALDLFPKGVDVDTSDFMHTPDTMDPVLIELLAAATLLTQSPSIARIEKIIRDEFSSDKTE